MAPSKSNAKVSNHLPDDVAFSILSKLPLKSLKRFTCVNKSWSLLFENPYFMTMFRKNFISAHKSLYDDTFLLINEVNFAPGHYDVGCALYLLYDDDDARFENKVKLQWPLPFQEEDTHELPLHIAGSGVHGIICLFDVNHENGVLWNPATKKYKHIVPSPAECLPLHTISFLLYGFGYDHVSDDYKVIRCVLITNQDFDGVELDSTYMPIRLGPLWEVYSWRSDFWRKLDVDMPIRYVKSGRAYSDVYLNGVCYWLGGKDGEKYVVSFHLSNEVFSTTPLPLDMHDSSDFEVERFLVLLNGSIAMISKYAKTASFHISILGELGIKESWAKLFIVGPLPCIESPIGAGKKGDIFFTKDDNQIVCFDLNTQTIKEVGVQGKFLGGQVAIYKQNLFPIRGVNNYLFL